MAFVTKIFRPDSPFFHNLGKIWELEAQLEEVVSLLQPEAKKARSNPVALSEFADQIVETAVLLHPA
eukprot:CAMPEP_0202979840 /NCGR_PEP_ID=MMETSP1396-20130829/85886_1 /ASSEMBLY_ACC=CAM_ASM_000872 /TAXON_ID= /ORGANISM="Pseudokeronopsis sp., Strain Brazil" /LENGTH=66 /DNA_ID=CAMNT_0049719455 /DNA_START=271 /DNA_END=471 /DNA_ORIENTATION=-